MAGGGGGEFGAVQRLVVIGIGLGEFARRAQGPFLEGEAAVVVGIEPGEGAAAGIVEFVEGDLAVIVAIGAVEAKLFARAVVRRRRLAWPAGDERLGGAPGRRRVRDGLVVVLRHAGSDEKARRHQQQGGSGAGDKSEHVPLHDRNL